MSELEIKSVQDLAKLTGWTVVKAEVVSGANIAIPKFILEIGHPAAEKNVRLVISPNILMQFSGFTSTAIPQLNVDFQNVEAET